MKLFSKIRDNLFSIFQTALIGLLVALVVVFVVVMIPDCPKWIFNLLGIAGTEEPKYEALKFLGIGMGGILIALQALMSYKRAKAMERTAEAQADAAKAQADAVAKTEQGQRQDRLKNAIEHLGHEKDSVRLGGAYELFHLAEDTEDLRQTVLDILCAYIRQTTSEDKYREKHKSKPSEEIQSLLTLLFVQKHKVFKDCHINLQESWLNGANLKEARLARAILTKAHLQEAWLREAQLQGAYLIEARLQEADLSKVQLQGAYLLMADSRGAYLSQSRLQGAHLLGASLQAANLQEAHMQGANLASAQLQGAVLSSARLQGATLASAGLLGASLDRVCLEGVRSQAWSSLTPFADRIRMSIGKETDLSRVWFGGIEQGGVDSLIEGLSDDKAMGLRECLRPHIGKPLSYQLPEDSRAIIGSYTAEEAEEWIAEYEKPCQKSQRTIANADPALANARCRHLRRPR